MILNLHERRRQVLRSLPRRRLESPRGLLAFTTVKPQLLQFKVYSHKRIVWSAIIYLIVKCIVAGFFLVSELLLRPESVLTHVSALVVLARLRGACVEMRRSASGVGEPVTQRVNAQVFSRTCRSLYVCTEARHCDSRRAESCLKPVRLTLSSSSLQRTFPYKLCRCCFRLKDCSKISDEIVPCIKFVSRRCISAERDDWILPRTPPFQLVMNSVW